MSRTTIIFVVVALLILGAAGYLIFGKPDTSATVVPLNTAGSEAELAFLNLTAQIDPVTFNASILSDPRFMALQDIRILIVPEPTGRTDPFGPLGR